MVRLLAGVAVTVLCLGCGGPSGGGGGGGRDGGSNTSGGMGGIGDIGATGGGGGTPAGSQSYSMVCTSNQACQGVPNTTCWAPESSYQVGMCLTRFTPSGTCPVGTRTMERYEPHNDTLCLRPCQADTDCPAQEKCLVERGEGTCVPTEWGHEDTPLKPVGGVCSANAECATGLCDTASPGGYCTAQCTTDSQCGSNGKCLAGTKSSLCLAKCTSSSYCRTGYSCVQLTSDPTTVCFPK